MMERTPLAIAIVDKIIEGGLLKIEERDLEPMVRVMHAWRAPNYVDQLEALIAEYRADEWRPIETAPKDGTVILAWCEFSTPVQSVQWCEHLKRFVDTTEGCYDVKPTHWQPLPPGPQGD